MLQLKCTQKVLCELGWELSIDVTCELLANDGGRAS